MNYQTLHLCNYDEVSDINSYINLIAADDAVIIYSDTISTKQHDFLKNHFKNTTVYFIIHKNNENIPSISYEKWVDLTTQYQRTFTWS